jgi:hypothetical protein
MILFEFFFMSVADCSMQGRPSEQHPRVSFPRLNCRRSLTMREGSRHTGGVVNTVHYQLSIICFCGPHFFVMLLQQERLAFVLLVIAAIGIILGSIFLGGIDKGTLAKDFSQAQPEGSLVRIDGIVEELRWTQTGGHLNARVEGTSVFIPSAVAKKITLRKGDRILVYGIIQTYRGEKEIVVQNAGDVKQLSWNDH